MFITDKLNTRNSYNNDAIQSPTQDNDTSA